MTDCGKTRHFPSVQDAINWLRGEVWVETEDGFGDHVDVYVTERNNEIANMLELLCRRHKDGTPQT